MRAESYCRQYLYIPIIHGVYGVYSRRNLIRAKSPCTTQLFVSSGCKPIQLLNRLLLKRVVNFLGQYAAVLDTYILYNHIMSWYVIVIRNIKHYSASDRHWTQRKRHENGWSDLYGLPVGLNFESWRPKDLLWTLQILVHL